MTEKPDLSASGSTKNFVIDIASKAEKALGSVITAIYRKYYPNSSKIHVEITSEDESRLFSTIATRYTQIDLPVVRIQMISESRRPEFLNRHVVATQGINIGTTKDRSSSILIHPVPIISEFQISFYTDDRDRAVDFARAYLSEQDRINFSIGITDPKFEFPHRMLLSDNIQIPTSLKIADLFDGFKVDVTAFIYTYIVTAEIVPNITKAVFAPIITNTASYNDKTEEIINYIETGDPYIRQENLEFTVDFRGKTTSLTSD